MPLNYSRWKYRITFALSPVTTVANRWVTLVLPWRVGINPDFSDLRFSDSAGNSLSYNVASKTDRVTATVKIEIQTAGTRLIHLYFGNSQAASESTASGTEDNNPVLTAVSGTTNPEYSGAWAYRQGGRLSQQGYTAPMVSGPYPQWRYKALIKISNPVSTANYQHKLTLTWLPGMRSDFRDLRFAQLNGKKCDYWIESYTSRTSAVVWIEVPTAGQRWINLFYGNSRAVSESSGANTFDFFDDFTSGILDTSTKWTVVSGTSYSISGGILSLNGATTTDIQGKTAFPSGYIFRSRCQFTCAGVLTACGFRSSKAVAFVGGYPTTNVYNSYQNDGVLESNTNLGSSYTGYHIWEIRRKSSSDNDWYIDDIEKTGASSGFTSDSLPPNLKSQGSASQTLNCDWVLVRKYTATEPTLTLVSHQPNSNRIIPYETLGTQPDGGTTHVMDPIEFGFTIAGAIDSTVLKPVIEFGHTITGSLGPTILQPIVDFGYTIAGSVISRNYIALDQLDLTQISVSKAVTDDIWAMNATIDGFTQLNTDVLRHATYATTDHLGVSQSIFAGILPKSSYTIRDAANGTVISGYDYAWYLSRQQVQAAYRHNTEGTNPATVIRGLLGGDDWEETTGIMPYAINSVTAWGDTLNSRVFDFTVGTTKKQAIDKICNYCRFVFMVKWIVVDGIATPAAYFVSEDDIDTDLDLPDPVTFAYPDPYLVGEIKPVAKGDERYNRVTVIGRDNTGGVFTATVESESVTNGDELAVEKIENSGSWTTQAQVDARAAELYGYYSATPYTYTAKLLDRMDLELLQKMRITGYTGVSENWMRITRIKKTVRATKDGTEKLVEIEFTEDTKWSALRRMYRYSSDDMTNEIETIVDNKIGQMPGLQVGVVTEIDGQEGTVTLESGETVTTRVV